MIVDLLDRLASLELHWFLLLTFFLPFGETVAFLDALVPGEVGMVLVGAAAAEAGVPIPVVIAVGALGAFCGDSTSWYIGHRWGYAFVNRWEPVRRRMEEPLQSAERYFARRGGQTVFAARFVGALRALVPLAAGISGMSYRSFLPWNAAASVLWVSLIVTLGAIYGESMAETVDRFGVLITVVVVVGAIGLFVRRRYKRRQGTHATSVERDP